MTAPRPLRVLQASAWYPPVHTGGTEVYVNALVKELRPRGIASRVIAPAAGDGLDYEYEGTTVRRYPVNATAASDELRGLVPHGEFSQFRKLLEEDRPDVYHQHSWTRGLGGMHLRAAREAGLKTVLTIHVASNICMRGTMKLFGKETCDGHIEPARCASCWSMSRGAPRLVGQALGSLPERLSERMGLLPLGKAATALSARALAERRKADFQRMTADADRVVAVCRWLYDALLLNGTPKEKLVLSRQGVDAIFADHAARAFKGEDEPAGDTFRLLFVGRWDPAKGIDVVVRAIRRLPRTLRLAFAIHGVGDSDEERAYASTVRRHAEGDSRISFEAHVSRDQLAKTLARADALAVPSLVLETGPLVVLEAKAAGIPVIGSRLGGIAELVREPEDGVLVPPGDEVAWAEALQALIAQPRRRVRDRVPSDVRTMRDVAAEMAEVYRSVAAPVQSELSCTA
jgi:glycosyltransferase involved in cell wall biosynthesis